MNAKELYHLIDNEVRKIERANGCVTQADCQRVWNAHADVISRAAAEEGIPVEDFCVSASEDKDDYFWSRMYSNEGMEEAYIIGASR